MNKPDKSVLPETNDADQFCGCERCLKAFPDGGWPPRESRWMILCIKCGNKRCPHAEWHGYECTRSNELGQVPVPTKPYGGA